MLFTPHTRARANIYIQTVQTSVQTSNTFIFNTLHNYNTLHKNKCKFIALIFSKLHNKYNFFYASMSSVLKKLLISQYQITINTIQTI